MTAIAVVDSPLTDAEAQVLALLGAGLSNAAIAAHLTVSINTVRFHLAAIREKRGGQGKGERWWVVLFR